VKVRLRLLAASRCRKGQWCLAVILGCVCATAASVATAAPPPVQPPAEHLHARGAGVSEAAHRHASPPSHFHIPLFHGHNPLSSPFTSTTEGTTHFHHGPVCEKETETGSCTKYYEGRLYYQGGEVLKQPKLYLIFWGSNWNTEEDKRWKGALVNTLRGMTTEYGFDETYQRILHQYWDEQTEPHQISNTVTVAGEWVYEGSAAPQNLTQEAVELEINTAIETNHWVREKDAMFMLMEPSGTAWTEAFAKFTECGYHEVDRWGDVYGLIPDDSDKHFESGCVSGTIQHSETETASHEYAEAVTDPHPLGEKGWTNEGGWEIADICDSGPEMLNEPLSIYVTALWGNNEKTCVIHDPPEEPPAPPTSTTEGSTGVGYHQATLTGSVNPNGGPEPHYYFEYGTTTAYGSYVPAPPGSGLGSHGSAAVPVSATPMGLKDNTRYHYRLVASTWAGSSYGADKEVVTPAPPPVANTEAATGLSETAATLDGSVNPEETTTTYQFEYWPRSKPTEIMKIPSTAQSVGNGTSNVHVSQRPETLAPLTEYTYRVVAVSAGGTTYGKEATFRTAPFMVNHAVASPGGAESMSMRDVSCTSTAWCMAVGGFNGSSKVTLPLAESWNGSEWKVVAPSLPSGAKEGSFGGGGVSCTSPSACTAVGSYTSSEGTIGVLIERWNGSSWVFESSPPAYVFELQGVACTSSTSCITVGYELTGILEFKPVVESWNGSEWKVVTTPATTGILRSISCSSSTACTAVGLTKYAGQPMAIRWNGTEWSKQSPAEISGGADLRGVFCVSSTSCVAVGENDGSPIANISETWNGSTWSTVSVPAPPGGKASRLSGVSCSSTTQCIAVGSEGAETGPTSAIADLWNGKEWQIMSVVLPSGTQTSSLSGVWCTSTLCSAAGSSEVNGADGALMDLSGQPFDQTESASSVSYATATLNGRVEPNGRKTTYHFEYGETTAYGHSAPTSEATIKVLAGSESASAALTGLNPGTTYHYRLVASNAEGTTYGADKTFTTLTLPWKVDSVASPGGAESVGMHGVSCTSTAWCMAVGGFNGSSKVALPLAESWNGTEWKVVSPLLPSGAKEGSFGAGGVSCTSPSACTAVGEYTNSGGTLEVLVERWNGSGWTFESSPQEGELHGVACTSSTSCFAVGFRFNAELEFTSVVESWNGSEWKVVSTPATTAALRAISCSSSTACTAVGLTKYAGQPMAVRWNGTEWSKQSPAEIGAGGDLQAISCVSSTSCVAVGESGGWYLGPPQAAISETWNGSTWSTVSVPAPPGAKESQLLGVSCSSITQCIAVGLQGEVIGQHTALTDLWNGKEWQIESLPLPEGATRSQFEGASCVGIYCWTIGSAEIKAEQKAVIDSN
jgi:hypothetical protein